MCLCKLILPFSYRSNSSDFIHKLTSRFSTNPANDVVRNWLEKLCDKLGVAITFTERIRKYLVYRANYVRRTHRALRNGRNQREFLAKNWKMEVYEQELSTAALRSENKQLRNESEASKKANEHLKKQIAIASEKLKKSSESMPLRPRDFNRSYSESHTRLLKRKRAEECEVSLAWLDYDGYSPTKIEMVDKRTGKVEVVKLLDHQRDELFGKDVTGDDIDMVNMLLYIKDRYNVSGGAYHEMTKICKSLPRSYKMKRRIVELNKKWNIWPTPEGTTGVQQSLEDRLRVRVAHLTKVAPPDASFRRTRTIKVKLSGDGANIGKRLHVVNFTFTVLDEGAAAYTSDGNHPLVIFNPLSPIDA